MNDKQKKYLNQWAPRVVPALSYLITFGMVIASIGMLAGSALFAIIFREWTIAGFGFLGAIVCGGLGVLGILRQLNMSYAPQQVMFRPGS